MDLTELTTIKITKAMKYFVIVFVACMMSMVVISCGGNSKSTETDRIAQLEDSIAKLNSQPTKSENNKEQIVKAATDTEAKSETNSESTLNKSEEKTGIGATTRNEFPSVLSGTTWVTTDQKIKLEFNGDKVRRYYSKPRRNYDDPVEWFNPGPDWNTFDNPEDIFYFYLIEQPERDKFKIQYRKESTGNKGVVNLVVENGKLYYADLQGRASANKYYLMEKIK